MIKKVNPVQDLGAWQQVKKFHKTGLGKIAIYGGVAGLALKVGLGYGLYKAGQASGKKKKSGGTKHKTTHITSYKKQPKKHMVG